MTVSPPPPVRSARRTRLLAALVLLGLSLAGAGSGRADAQQPPQPGQVVQSWALAPTGTDPNEPSSRPALTYTAEPGSRVEDSVTLWNYSNVQLTFRIYSTDAFNNSDGAFDLLPGTDAPKDVGSWIELPQGFVTVPPSSKIDLPITLAVPDGARPGDHAGAILASNEAQGTGPDGKAVTLDRRTGTRIYVRVGGPLEPALTVTKARSVYHASIDPRKGSLDVTYTVRNVGNVRLGATQRVTVKNVLGRKMDSSVPPPIEEILPDNEIVVTQHYDDVTATVRVGADIKVTPTSGALGGETTAKATARTAGTWAFPWILLLIALLIVLAQRGVRWFRRRSGGPVDDPRLTRGVGQAPPA